MTRTFTAASALLLTLLSGCTHDKYPVATGGSRSDGTVKLSYTVGAWEQVQVHTDAAQSEAEAKCKAWGYTGAQAFGGNEMQCQVRNGFGNCLSSQVTLTYQCLGAPTADHPANQP